VFLFDVQPFLRFSVILLSKTLWFYLCLVKAHNSVRFLLVITGGSTRRNNSTMLFKL